jgi:hypothetical protein
MRVSENWLVSEQIKYSVNEGEWELISESEQIKYSVNESE